MRAANIVANLEASKDSDKNAKKPFKVRLENIENPEVEIAEEEKSEEEREEERKQLLRKVADVRERYSADKFLADHQELEVVDCEGKQEWKHKCKGKGSGLMS